MSDHATTIVSPGDPMTRTMAMMDRLESVMDDPEVVGLIAILASEGISDAYAESIRAQLREITYQARLVLGGGGVNECDRPVMGSGNVYRDFGFPDPEGMLAKADVVIDLLRSMERQSLTNELAAEVIGITPDDLSRITRGHFEDRTLDELTGYLQALQAGEAA